MSITAVGKALAKQAYTSHTAKVQQSRPDRPATLPLAAGQFIFNYMNLPSVQSGGITYPDTASHPVHTSATGQSSRGKNVAINIATKKQIRSTSHSQSRRRYYYGKKRRYRN